MPEKTTAAKAALSAAPAAGIKKHELDKIQFQQTQECFQLQQAQRQELIQMQQQQAQELRQLQQTQAQQVTQLTQKQHTEIVDYEVSSYDPTKAAKAARL